MDPFVTVVATIFLMLGTFFFGRASEHQRIVHEYEAIAKEAERLAGLATKLMEREQKLFLAERRLERRGLS